MTNILKTLAVTLALAAGTIAASGPALAGPDTSYHWAYPDNLKANAPHQSFGVGSGIPDQYR